MKRRARAGSGSGDSVKRLALHKDDDVVAVVGWSAQQQRQYESDSGAADALQELAAPDDGSAGASASGASGGASTAAEVIGEPRASEPPGWPRIISMLEAGVSFGLGFTLRSCYACCRLISSVSLARRT